MAKDGMSFEQYIKDPGNGAHVITQKDMYKSLYTSKFDNILVREQGKINYAVYEDNGVYYIHIKVPSEVIPQFYYDVVVQLSTNVNEKRAENSLKRYMVRFFSNDPAFCYTFAHAFKKNDMFIDELKDKMLSKALSKTGTERNPKDDIFYVKSLYFAYLTMNRYDLFNRKVITAIAKKFDKKILLHNIEHAETKIKARQDEAAKIEKERAKQKRDQSVKFDNDRNKYIKVPPAGVTKTSRVSTVSKITPKNKTTKTTRAVGKH